MARPFLPKSKKKVVTNFRFAPPTNQALNNLVKTKKAEVGRTLAPKITRTSVVAELIHAAPTA